MPTANEKKALWFLALIALSGSSVRVWRARIPTANANESAALETQIGRVDSVRAMRHRNDQRASTPRQPSGENAASNTSGPRSPLDLDQATNQQIEALPGIGPSLAQRIVAYRDSVGAFGDIAALCDVRGVGPALLEKLRPLVTFTGPRRPLSAACGAASRSTPKTRRAHVR